MHHPVYMSHDDITQSPARTAYERSRSLTPDPTRATSYAQNPIYGRMGISPERPPPPQENVGPPDRLLGLRTIPENYLMLNGYKNGGHIGIYDYMDGGIPQRPYPRQAMSPPAIPSGPRIEPSRRAFSPPANLQNYEYVQVFINMSSFNWLILYIPSTVLMRATLCNLITNQGFSREMTFFNCV